MSENSNAKPTLFLVVGAIEDGKDGFLWGIVEISEEQADGRAPIDPIEQLSKPRLFDAKMKKHAATVGAIYRIEATERTIYPSTSEFVRLHPDPAESARLSSMSRALIREIDARKARKKREKTDPLRVALEPVRDAYLAMPNTRRAQLLAEVVEYITRR